MVTNTRYRVFLKLTIGAMCLFAILAFAFVFGVGLLPSGSTGGKRDTFEVVLSDIPEGGYEMFQWGTLPVVVVRPDRATMQELIALNQNARGEQFDPNSNPIAFAYIPISPAGGCVVRPIDQPLTDKAQLRGWSDPCQKGTWDLSGRALRTSDGSDRRGERLKKIDFVIVSGDKIELHR